MYFARRLLVLTALALAVPLVSVLGVSAATRQTSQNPQSGAVGLEGTISTAAPTRGATITTPSNGATFSSTPITVAGLCPTDTLVKIFDNNVFVGSTLCINGSYSLQIDLFGGSNQLVARVYDALDQAGPDSNTVTVIFNDAQFAKFGSRVTLTSAFARRGAFPGTVLTWPLSLAGGTGPYAVSIDWGDGTAVQLLSLSGPGAFDIKHTYTNAGYYKVIVRATDKNGTTAYLQLIAVANGAAQAGNADGGAKGGIQTNTIIMWWPFVVLLPLIVVAFWLGRRHQMAALRKQLDIAKQQ